MKMLRLALCLSLAPLPGAAEPDCLAQPTRACVFQLALRQAVAEDRPVIRASGLLAVAVLQEEEGTGDATQTRAALLAQLLKDAPEPTFAHQVLRSAATLLWTSAVPLGDAPDTDAWLQATLADLSRMAGLPVEDIYSPAEIARASRIRAQVASTPADRLARFARLETGRGPEIPRQNLRDAGFYMDMDPVREGLLAGLFAKGALSGARAEIASWTDPAERANGFAALALAYARAGDLATALDLARRPDLTATTLLSEPAKEGLVEVWARAGAQKADEIAPEYGRATALPPNFQPGFRARITISMVMGDITTAHALLMQVRHGQRAIAVMQALDAGLDHDPARGAAFVALFPREEQAELFQRLGEAQLQVGDVEGAQATLALMEPLPDAHIATILLREALAPLMAATGREEEAVQLAAEMKDATVTALVAARLE